MWQSPATSVVRRICLRRESSSMETSEEVRQTAAIELLALLDGEGGAMVILVADDTRLVVHRAVLAARSPVFEAMFRHDTLETRSGQVTITDVEGPVLRQLVVYLYTLQAPQLRSMASKLLRAADKYGVLLLKAECERQLGSQLTVENAAATAVFAVQHSCTRLRTRTINFINVYKDKVTATQGWADALHTHPEDMAEVGRLLTDGDSVDLSDFLWALSHNCHSDKEVQQTTVMDLGALLDAKDGAVVTLVVEDTQLVVHRAVLVTRSPVFEAMFSQYTLATSSSQVAITDIDVVALRHLLAYLYTLQFPQLPDMAPKLLPAAGKYGVLAECEQQVASQLTAENAAATAVLAVKHSYTTLSQATIAYMKAHTHEVLATQGWADMVRTQPEHMVEVCRLLIEALRSLPGQEKKSRLNLAAKDGAVEELQMLLTAGADVGVVNRFGTALHTAAWKGHLEVVRCLVENGADVDARDFAQKRTPLHVAAVNGHRAVVHLLMASSANPYARDKKGLTPLNLAVRSGHREVMTALFQGITNRMTRTS